jgi:hypothetical protein
VYVRDLSWEDKELVLRILFAKMNGLKTSIDSMMRGRAQAGTGTGGGGAGAGGYAYAKDPNSMPAPVFISEVRDSQIVKRHVMIVRSIIDSCLFIVDYADVPSEFRYPLIAVTIVLI